MVQPVFQVIQNQIPLQVAESPEYPILLAHGKATLNTEQLFTELFTKWHGSADPTYAAARTHQCPLCYFVLRKEEKLDGLGRKRTDFHSQKVSHCVQDYSCWWIKVMSGSVSPHIRQHRDEVAIFVWTALLPPSHCTTLWTSLLLFLLSRQWINPQVSVTAKVLPKDCMSVSIPNVCRSHNRDKNRKERKIRIRLKKYRELINTQPACRSARGPPPALLSSG